MFYFFVLKHKKVSSFSVFTWMKRSICDEGISQHQQIPQTFLPADTSEQTEWNSAALDVHYTKQDVLQYFSI